MALERLTSLFELENTYANITKENDIAKITLIFRGTNEFFREAPKILQVYNEMRWHGHLVKNLRVGIYVANSFYSLAFSNFVELGNWLDMANKNFNQEKDKHFKYTFLRETVRNNSSKSGPGFSTNETDMPSRLSQIKILFDVNVRSEYDLKKYQEFILNDVEEDYGYLFRKRKRNIEEISDDEEREIAIALEELDNKDRSRINREKKFKNAYQEVEANLGLFAEEFSEYGDGILKLNKLCNEKASKRFKSFML